MLDVMNQYRQAWQRGLRSFSADDLRFSHHTPGIPMDDSRIHLHNRSHRPACVGGRLQAAAALPHRRCAR
jgi:hypothetical protein